MWPANLPSHTRICRAASERAVSQSQLLRKSHQLSQVTSTSSLHGNRVRNNCCSQGTKGALVGREENRELVSPGNTGEVSDATMHSQNAASKTFPVPNPAGNTISSSYPQPQLYTLGSAVKSCQAPGAPSPNSLRAARGKIHIDKSEIPGTAFSPVHLALVHPERSLLQPQAGLSLSRGRRGQEEMKLRSNNVCSSTLPSPFVFANPKDLLELSRDSLKVSNVFFPVSDVLDNS